MFNLIRKGSLLFACFSSLCCGLIAEEKQKLDSFYDEGFWLKGEQASLRIGGLVQVDGRFFLHTLDNHSTFLIRRARIYLTGTFQDLWGYMIMGRWDRQVPDLHYAWIETTKPAELRVRFGLFKEPFSLEALYSDAYWDFNERSLAIANFLQQEDIGAMAFGKLFHERLEYSIGVFNGRGRRLDNNYEKEYIGRIVVSPIHCGPFKHLYLGASGSISRQKEELDADAFTFKTGAGTPFWIWEDDVSVNADRVRWGADLEWLYGPMALRAEYIHVDWGKVGTEDLRERFTGWGWYVEGAYILTGEDKPRNKRLIPKHNFDYTKCSWGAWEIVGRYEEFKGSNNILEAGLAVGSSRAQAGTFGVNCYLNPQMIFKFNWQEIYFTDRTPIEGHEFKRESVIIARLQVEI